LLEGNLFSNGVGLISHWDAIDSYEYLCPL
jgi:hypothetical protein